MRFNNSIAHGRVSQKLSGAISNFFIVSNIYFTSDVHYKNYIVLNSIKYFYYFTSKNVGGLIYCFC
jgi:hypothetical protein